MRSPTGITQSYLETGGKGLDVRLSQAPSEVDVGVLDSLFINVDCPNCGYGVDVEILLVQLEATIFCPCCKISIHLVDADASLYGAQGEVDLALKSLQRELKKLDTTITFKI